MRINEAEVWNEETQEWVPVPVTEIWRGGWPYLSISLQTAGPGVVEVPMRSALRSGESLTVRFKTELTIA